MLPKIALFVLALAGASLAAKLPARFQKCNRHQPDLNQCIAKAAHDGMLKLDQPLEELQLPNINPFEVPEVTIGAAQGTVAVEQKFHNCKLYGFNKTEIKKFEFDFDNKTLSLESLIPELSMLCQYELNGRVLILPVTGAGPSTINLKNLRVRVDFKYEELKKKGKTYMKFVSSDVALKPGLITFDFENLFNGDKNLGDNLNRVLNDNWEEVFAEVQDGYVEIVRKILVSLFNGFFSKVSMEEALE